MANHLQTLSGLSNEQRDEYIQEMLQGNAMAHTLNYCGDTTINAVMTAKEAMMCQKKIRLDWKLDVSSPLPYGKADICALFANALDNAAEACEEYRRETDEKKELTVTLDARFQKGMFAVSVKNPASGSAEIKNDARSGLLPKTTKKDSKNHGFGLRSIREIVERYQGTMEIRREEGQFELFLYLMSESVS